MARAYAAIVNGGRVLQPTIGSEVVDPISGRVDLGSRQGPARDEPADHQPGCLETVMGGLSDVTNTQRGHRVAVFGALGGIVAGKTGTAENKPRADHSWFVGYGPANGAAPKYVVAVVIENAGLGAGAAAPVACKTLAAR